MKIVWNQFIMCTIKWRLNTVYLVCAFAEPLYAPIYYLFKYVQCILWILSCFVWANTKLIVTLDRSRAYENKQDAIIGRSLSEWIKQQRQCQHTDTKCRTQRGKWLWWMKLLFFAQYSLIQLIIFYIYDDTNGYYFAGYYGQAINVIVEIFNFNCLIKNLDSCTFFYIPDIRIKKFIIRSKNASARPIWYF